MATDVYNALLSFDGIKVKDYEGLCATVKDHYLLAIVKFLARREGYNIIHNEIVALQVRPLLPQRGIPVSHMLRTWCWRISWCLLLSTWTTSLCTWPSPN